MNLKETLPVTFSQIQLLIRIGQFIGSFFVNNVTGFKNAESVLANTTKSMSSD